ncbi:hypothetical protein NM688_g7251 [Phlebia brevispora]|uniref:Uncharacterized protein n=1 Tax=Phlebia brevispora TaxID=194682 RepID=A0ACC1S7M2_9APHY|nr:hypothetical protein NM688_g7251 [Phlebia brevispora]
MPKVPPSLPVSGLFAVAKPSGPVSMHVVNEIKKLLTASRMFVEAEKLQKQKAKGKHKKSRFARDVIKIGQGGTLDPLADGVLVIGVGKGTKKLSRFLDGAKEYRTTALLGCETDSFDSEGAVVRVAPWKHVTREKVEEALEKFRGEIVQTPPIFSALKMDGKHLYDYAREGIPLPRPIEKRSVTIHSLDLVEWKGSDHDFHYPEKKFTEEQKRAVEKAMHGIENQFITDDQPEAQESTDERPTAFVLRMKVSGGTYVRSIVHDLGHAVGSAAHVVTLTRSRQSRFALEPTDEDDLGCVPWEVFTKALEDPGEPDAEGWHEWEREVLDKMEIVEGKDDQEYSYALSFGTDHHGTESSESIADCIMASFERVDYAKMYATRTGSSSRRGFLEPEALLDKLPRAAVVEDALKVYLDRLQTELMCEYVSLLFFADEQAYETVPQIIRLDTPAASAFKQGAVYNVPCALLGGRMSFDCHLQALMPLLLFSKYKFARPALKELQTSNFTSNCLIVPLTLPPDFPQELLLEIFEYVAAPYTAGRIDPRSLTARWTVPFCTLVSRKWRPLVQSIQWREFSFHFLSDGGGRNVYDDTDALLFYEREREGITHYKQRVTKAGIATILRTNQHVAHEAHCADLEEPFAAC